MTTDDIILVSIVMIFVSLFFRDVNMLQIKSKEELKFLGTNKWSK